MLPRRNRRTARAILSVALGSISPLGTAFARGAESPPASESAKIGAVELTLTLYQQKIRVGEHLFARLRLTNHAQEDWVITDYVYRGHPDLEQVWWEGRASGGYPFEIVDSAGRRFPSIGYYPAPPPVDGPLTVGPADTATDATFDRLLKSGLTPEQANEKINRDRYFSEQAAIDDKYPAIQLKTGQSCTTASWCQDLNPASAAPNPAAVTCPGNGFVELYFYEFKAPGKYRIRAEYGRRPKHKQRRHSKNPWDVYARTQWIAFEVVP